MLSGLTGWHWVIILLIILLLFGAPKLPGLARSIGESLRILKQETSRLDERGPGDTAANGEETSTPDDRSRG